MRLTTKFRYGSRAVLEIARNASAGPVKRKDIVRNQGIPDSYLENILIDLKKGGLIKAIRGPRGGFALIGKPEEISLFDVALVFEGSLSPTDCLLHPESCKRVSKCVTRGVWEKLKAAREKVLKEATISSLLEGLNGISGNNKQKRSRK
jgi:Rrf2 family protein